MKQNRLFSIIQLNLLLTVATFSYAQNSVSLDSSTRTKIVDKINSIADRYIYDNRFKEPIDISGILKLGIDSNGNCYFLIPDQITPELKKEITSQIRCGNDADAWLGRSIEIGPGVSTTIDLKLKMSHRRVIIHKDKEKQIWICEECDSLESNYINQDANKAPIERTPASYLAKVKKYKYIVVNCYYNYLLPDYSARIVYVSYRGEFDKRYDK